MNIEDVASRAVAAEARIIEQVLLGLAEEDGVKPEDLESYLIDESYHFRLLCTASDVRHLYRGHRRLGEFRWSFVGDSYKFEWIRGAV